MRWSGAQASNRRFSPTSGKRTTASALSPLPSMSTITPSPNFSWRTSSPTAGRDARRRVRRWWTRSPRADRRCSAAASHRRRDDGLAMRSEPAPAPLLLTDCHQQVRGDLVEEPARRSVVGAAEQHATPRVAEVQPLLGPGDADVAEPAFLFELVGVAEAAHVREHAVFETDEEHDRELEALRRVQRHQRDRAQVGIGFVDVGDERDGFEERLHAVEPFGVTVGRLLALADTRRSRRARSGRRRSIWSSNSRAEPMSSCRFSTRPCASTDRSDFELGEVAALRERPIRARPPHRRPRRLPPTPSARAGPSGRRAPCR